jgi:purine nucleoside permease
VLNAALAITALTSSPRFDLRETYFLVSGIAGVNPKRATLGSVTFPRFAVQVDLQYEFDAREIPGDWNTGYVPQGASEPGQYPKILYGTEVYELNNDLRTKMLDCVSKVGLDDSEAASNYRARYAGAPDNAFRTGAMKPSVTDGDVASSNVFFHGHLLAEACEEFFNLITCGRGSYSMTQQEDNATLGALLRSTLQGRTDFSRIIIMRAGSNFDRSISDTKRPAIPLHVNHGGLDPSLENLYRVGRVVVKEIIDGWESTYREGVKATNYIGDIFGALGGTPDFGPGAERA